MIRGHFFIDFNHLDGGSCAADFFCNLYEFHNPVKDAPVLVPVFVPAINFVPAVNPVSASSPVSASVSSTTASETDYSVISSVNFAFPTSTPSCIGQIQ